MNKINSSIKHVAMSIMFALSLVFMLGGTTTVKAADDKPAPAGQITDLKQVSARENSVTISFGYNGVDKPAGYEVQFSLDGVTWSDAASSETTSSPGEESIYKLNTATHYQVRVVPFSNGRSWDATKPRTYGTPSAAIDVITNISGKTAGIYFASASTTSMTYAWEPVPGASGYLVKCFNEVAFSQKDDIPFVDVGNVTSFTFEGLEPGCETNFMVAAYIQSAAGFQAVGDVAVDYTDAPTVPVKTSTPKLDEFYKNIGIVYLSYNSCTSTRGTEVEVYSIGKETKEVTVAYGSATSARFDDPDLKKNSFFKARVRAYSENTNGDKQFGEWSDWGYFANEPSVSLSSKKSGLLAKWSKTAGADKYTVYISTDNKHAYKKVCTTKKNSVLIKKCGKKKLKKDKTYYVYVVAYKKIGGQWYKSYNVTATYSRY